MAWKETMYFPAQVLGVSDGTTPGYLVWFIGGDTCDVPCEWCIPIPQEYLDTVDLGSYMVDRSMVEEEEEEIGPQDPRLAH